MPIMRPLNKLKKLKYSQNLQFYNTRIFTIFSYSSHRLPVNCFNIPRSYGNSLQIGSPATDKLVILNDLIDGSNLHELM